MTQSEWKEALALIEEVQAQDHKVGAALGLLLHHLADLAGLSDDQPSKEAPTAKGEK